MTSLDGLNQNNFPNPGTYPQKLFVCSFASLKKQGKNHASEIQKSAVDS